MFAIQLPRVGDLRLISTAPRITGFLQKFRKLLPVGNLDRFQRQRSDLDIAGPAQMPCDIRGAGGLQTSEFLEDRDRQPGVECRYMGARIRLRNRAPSPESNQEAKT